MKKLIILLILLCTTARADDQQEMRNILQANFDACNNEDVDALMATFSVDTPNKEEFRKASEKLFREKDIYYRLVDLRINKIQGNFATATVIQLSHTNDRNSDTDRESWFRNGTTLLTKDECVRYDVTFKKDGRTWKCLETISEPVPCEIDELEKVPAR